MTQGELENIYESLALKIDALEGEAIQVYMAKLILLMADDIGDADRVARYIESAANDLSPSGGSG